MLRTPRIKYHTQPNAFAISGTYGTLASAVRNTVYFARQSSIYTVRFIVNTTTNVAGIIGVTSNPTIPGATVQANSFVLAFGASGGAGTPEIRLHNNSNTITSVAAPGGLTNLQLMQGVDLQFEVRGSLMFFRWRSASAVGATRPWTATTFSTATQMPAIDIFMYPVCWLFNYTAITNWLEVGPQSLMWDIGF
jgi:hypothetical protein